MDKLLVVGSDSDLIQPLIQGSPENKLEVLPLSRQDWDLRETAPPIEVLKKIHEFQPKHILYAAGLNIPQDIEQEPISVIQSVRQHFDVNCMAFLSTVFHVNRLLSEPLISIHVLSSLYGIYGRKNRLPYSVGKHALEGSVKCLAIELPSSTVLAYRPGFFSTKLTDQNLSSMEQEKLKEKIPIGRLGQSSELSALLLRNILDPPFYATGTFITMDGGLTAGGIFQL
jgi:NAD(P)-dependent dehydrogenase (short-subunit alcohol dehydrogenase family)